jgi:hypothetical protein
MQVINVDKSDSKVTPTTLDLVPEIASGKTVPATDYIVGLHDAGSVVLAVEEATITFLCRGRSTIERDIPTLCANDDFVASNGAFGNQDANSFTNGALRSLASVVDGGIEKVDAFADSGDDGRDVSRVVGIVAFAEVSPESKRRYERTVSEQSIKLVSLAADKALSETLCSDDSRAAFKE